MQTIRFTTAMALFTASTILVQTCSRSAQALPMAGGNATIYCNALPNSSGATAHIGYTGSLTLSEGTFELRCSGVPLTPSSFGIYVYGQTQMNVPFGNGYLCIQPLGGMYRMAPQSLSNTTITRGVSEAPAEFLMFQPGSTWNFQFWYRDVAAGGSNFNLSEGLAVQFGV
jgi:hypothetical protein